jgi:hypothetical protein
VTQYAVTKTKHMPANRIVILVGALRIILLAERLGHPRREWKPEFKEGRYPPLDVPACSLLFLV